MAANPENPEEGAANERRGLRRGRAHGADGNPGAAAEPKKSRRSVFGPPPDARPDVLPVAETVAFPKLVSMRAAAAATATPPAGKGATEAASPTEADVTQTPATANVTEADAAKTGAAERDVTRTRAAWTVEAEPAETATPGHTVPVGHRKPSRHADRGLIREPEQPYTPTKRQTRISRTILLVILCVQALMSLRLHNTAFEDESLYLYAGRMELEHMLHGSALQGSYASYFSGAPVLYPVAAAALNMIGGLALARALSLVEMLCTTALLYSLTRRLFNERAALFASLFFSVTESALFLGNFATYDATCLFLLACGAWIVVRTANQRWPLFLLAAPVVTLAVAVKYAGALFVPTIAVLAALAGWQTQGRRMLLRPVLFGVAVAALLYGALRLGGSDYTTALQSTTTNRAQGATPVTTLLREFMEWGGILFLLAVFGTVAYTFRVRTEPEEQIAPAGGGGRRLALGVLLTGTALLAPAYQAHLHTDISFLKHIGFGLFFAAPMAGFGLARVVGDHYRRPQVGIAVWCAALVFGLNQSQSLYHQWPDSTNFVTAFAKYLKPGARYLVEVPEVPIYYLEGKPDAQPDQFSSTFYIAYTDKQGQTLYGPEGFQAAVEAGYFQVITFNGTVTPSADGAITLGLRASGKYYLAKQIKLSDADGPVTYQIWVKGKRPVKHSPKTKRTAAHGASVHRRTTA